jgi:protein gp37
MGETTGISWTDHTFNPWWGCVRVSPGCENCYAETSSNRWGNDLWGVDKPRKFFGDKHWNEPRKWDRKAREDGVQRRVFVASMADVLEDRRDLDVHRERLWLLIEETPNLQWLVLTKRIENLHLFPERWWRQGFPPNVRVGVTVESQPYAERRLDTLVGLPVKNFVSAEPLLGALDLRRWLHGSIRHLDWVIPGGESTQNTEARECETFWILDLVRQCKEAGVAVFVKQMGSRPMVEGNLLRLADRRHGGDIAEWPEELRVQEFPD